jgi:uncharacterized protein YbjQ (UPF0145 family)
LAIVTAANELEGYRVGQYLRLVLGIIARSRNVFRTVGAPRNSASAAGSPQIYRARRITEAPADGTAVTVEPER